MKVRTHRILTTEALRARARAKAAVGLACALAALATCTLARAEPLSADATARLMRGETLVFDKTLESDGHRYIGGLTYTVVGATENELAALLEDTAAYRSILPRTKEARVVSKPTGEGPWTGRDFFVELRQGNSLMETVYTLDVRKYPEEHTVKFWLDPTRPHGIDDAWGFFRYEALRDAPITRRAGGDDLREPTTALRPTFLPPGAPSVLLTYGVLVDVGPGVLREFFEDRLRTVLLSVPGLVRTYVENASRAPKKT